MAVTIVDIESVHPWREDEIEAASAAYWTENYWAEEISNVRPIHLPIAVPAKRKIYFIEMNHA